MAYTTDQYEGTLAETISIQGHNGDNIHAYMARPMGVGPFPGVVLIPHALGWTDFHKETAFRFAHNGYIAVVPDIWCRVAHGAVDDVIRLPVIFVPQRQLLISTYLHIVQRKPKTVFFVEETPGANPAPEYFQLATDGS